MYVATYIDVMYRTYGGASLMIIVKKTEVLCQPSDLVHHKTDASFSADGEHIKCTVNFPYLGTVLSSTCRNDELQNHSIKSFLTTLWYSLSKQELVHLHRGLIVQSYMLIHPSL